MEKGLFHELYKRSCELEMGRCPSPALSGFLHGYLSVYSMVRIYPWLEESFGEPYEIHERVREIARFIEPLAGNKNLPADVRAGYVVDLMDAYLLYSDMKFVDVALDAAYEILIPKGSDKIVLPCRTPNICRLLCNCYYFTEETDVAQLAIRLVMETLGQNRIFTSIEMLYWMKALILFKNVFNEIQIPAIEHEYFQIKRRGEQYENEKIENFCFNGLKDLYSINDVFEILARREFVLYGEKCKQK